MHNLLYIAVSIAENLLLPEKVQLQKSEDKRTCVILEIVLHKDIQISGLNLFNSK